MPRKPTGNPRGRPKTKEYATWMARLPQELIDRGNAYRHTRRLSVSDVIREGVELLLSAPDILSYRYDNVSDRNIEVSDTNGALSPVDLGDIPDVSPGYGFADEGEEPAPVPPGGAPVAPAPAEAPLTARVLAAVQGHAQPQTCHALAQQCGGTPHATHKALETLCARGQVVKAGRRTAATYALVRAQ